MNYTKKFLNYLFKKLNIINDINFDKKQWNILLGSWLFYYLSACYNKYLKLQTVFKINRNLKSIYRKVRQKN